MVRAANPGRAAAEALAIALAASGGSEVRPKCEITLTEYKKINIRMIVMSLFFYIFYVLNLVEYVFILFQIDIT